jgi:hypothetical protein
MNTTFHSDGKGQEICASSLNLMTLMLLWMLANLKNEMHFVLYYATRRGKSKFYPNLKRFGYV